MTDNILVVTHPDDIFVDGIRILHVGLDPEQQQLVSTALMSTDLDINIVNYVWKTDDPIDWLLDKKHKSNLILFNANGFNDTIIGYLAAHQNSYYFGTLKDLQLVNNRAIYSVDTIIDLLKNLKKYVKI
jgi:hypothetical protein|tara:strand:- start:874 stop:1260 length:387 start_codon:yes stop_codon:yes gene_type:complete